MDTGHAPPLAEWRIGQQGRVPDVAPDGDLTRTTGASEWIPETPRPLRNGESIPLLACVALLACPLRGRCSQRNCGSTVLLDGESTREAAAREWTRCPKAAAREWTRCPKAATREPQEIAGRVPGPFALVQNV